MLHVAGLASTGAAHLILPKPMFEDATSHVMEAGLIPAVLMDAPTALDQAGSSIANGVSSPAAFNLQTAPIKAIPPLKPTPKTQVKGQIKSDASVIAQKSVELLNGSADSPLQGGAASANTVNAVVSSNLPLTTPSEPSPIDKSSATVQAQTNPANQGNEPSATPVQKELTTANPIVNNAIEPQSAPTIPASTYRLPTQLRVNYAANARGISGKASLVWRKGREAETGGASPNTYDAELNATVTFFKTFQYGLKSSGQLTRSGITPLRIEEKRTNGSTVATTVEPQNNRVIISSQEGFQPYSAGGQDLLGLMLELGVFVQTQPKWATAGTAYDFVVYRPSGIKKWRFQSQGLQMIEVAGQQVQTVHIRRVATDNQPDFEDQQFLWLDPKRYGFPVKMRWVDSKQNVTDINMIEWLEG